MGSGHILIYAFDVFMQIYVNQGWNPREAAVSILENNIYGLDIDKRAFQLAYFSLMMKGRQYNRRILDNYVHPNVYVISSSRDINKNQIKFFGDHSPSEMENELSRLVELYSYADEYGSILKVEDFKFASMEEYVSKLRISDQMNFDTVGIEITQERMYKLIKLAKVMSQKYDVVITNPPYLGSPRMGEKLLDYIKMHYSEGKADFSAVMYLAVIQNYLKKNGFVAFITTNSWMYLKSFAKERSYVFNRTTFDTIVDYGTELFEGKIGHWPVVAWVSRNTNLEMKFVAIRLIDYKYSRRDEKDKEFFNEDNRYISSLKEFRTIDGMPVAYWIGGNLLNAFVNGNALKNLGDTRQGMATSDNNRFLRNWFEVCYDRIGFGAQNSEVAKNMNKKWYPYNKGGDYRKWYGNMEYVINYENDGYEVKEYATSLYKTPSRTIKSMSEYFKPCISWSKISAGSIAFRYYPKGFIFDVAGCCIFYKNFEDMYYDFGIVNSNVAKVMLEVISPTLNYEAGHVASLPIIKNNKYVEEINSIVKANIELAREDWNDFEISWDFARHPLISSGKSVAEGYELWESRCKQRRSKLIEYETRLNTLFIDIYGVRDEVANIVNEDEITLREAELQRDVRSLISYAVGCMFGRYSVYEDGLAYAGGQWDINEFDNKARRAEGKSETIEYYQRTYFLPDADNVIPITDDEYFNDDIVGMLCDWLCSVYRSDTLEENLDFIAKALGNKGDTSREVIRNYFLKDFMADHMKIYQKRPIYWLFDSGKENGFKALIYMHRYNQDTVGVVRTDYLHKTQKAIEQAMQRAEYTKENASSAADKKRAVQQINKYTKQLAQMKSYDEAMAHIANQRIEIDLDDGVKVNYEKFQGVEVAQEGKKALKIDLLAKIK